MALTLTNAEIVNCLPIVANYLEKGNGGTTTTLTSKALKTLDAEEVEGTYICFLSGPNRGVDRIITDFTATSEGTFTFAALDTAVDNTTQFAIVLKGFLPCIERASELIENDFRNKGLDLSLFLTTSQLKQLHIYLVLSNICMMKRQDATAEDVFHQDYLRYQELYATEFANLVADYDANGDGTISSAEENTRTNQIGFAR